MALHMFLGGFSEGFRARGPLKRRKVAAVIAAETRPGDPLSASRTHLLEPQFTSAKGEDGVIFLRCSHSAAPDVTAIVLLNNEIT